MKKITALTIILVLLITNIFAVELNVNKSRKNLVKFISDAPVEDFEGITEKIDGYMITVGFDRLEGSEMYFEVDLESVDTGIGLRNRHMRENYLHTDKYPITWFKGKIINAIKENDGRAKVIAEGDMFIHGVTKKIKVDGVVSTNNQGSYRLQSKFEVKLTDYKIEVPQFMFMRISEVIQLVLDFYMLEVKE
jgi:polyisoprenoid-binding protein YceI